MPPRELPNLNLMGFAPQGEANWDVWMNQNMLKLSALVQPRVRAIQPTLPSTGLNNGDVYIATTGTNANRIAVRDNNAWVYFSVQPGFRVYEMTNAVFYKFDGSNWLSENADLTASANAPALELRKKGSPAGANAPLAAYSTMGSFRWLGWNGAAWRTGVQIMAQTQGLWSGSNNSSAVLFQVAAPGTTNLVDALQVNATELLPAQTDKQKDIGSRTTRWKKIWTKDLSMVLDGVPWPNDVGEVVFAVGDNNTFLIRRRASASDVYEARITMTKV